MLTFPYDHGGCTEKGRDVVFVSTFQCSIHNILKRAKYVGKLIIKAAWRTCRFNSCVGSVYRNNPVPSAVERDKYEFQM